MIQAIELNNEDLSLIKELELSILKEFDRICRKHNIKYSLAGGTLIGAIRHCGFIPWDDDVDVMMLRSDYEFFLNLAPSELNSEIFKLENYNTDAVFGEPFTKIELKNTVFKELFIGNASLKLNGVFIDVFPLDNAPDNSLKRAFHRFRNYELRKRILIKSGYNFNKTGIKKILYSMLKISTLPSKELLIRAYKKNAIKYNNLKTKHVVSLCGSYGYQKEIRPRSYFDNYIEVIFEGYKFFAIKQYDQELRHIYGDYLSLPPEEKRICKHLVQELDLSYYGGRKIKYK